MSLISPPYAPAFILTAPPMLPGIPVANSKPASPLSASLLPSLDNIIPDITFTVTSSIYSTSSNVSESCITTPLIPLSDTKRLLPLPITQYSMSDLFKN